MKTAVSQIIKELQEQFPKEMEDIYEKNQLLIEDIALRAKKNDKITMINALVEFSKAHFDIHTEEAILNITRRAEKYYKENFKTTTMKQKTLLPNQILNVSGYKLGNTTLALTYKPKWIHRKMMKIFFGVRWVDETKQQEQ
jgi:hypothetical protein